MKTSVETLDPVKVKLTVEVEPKRVKQAFDRAARELAKQVSIPGFRPGKAPRRLLEQRLGSGAIATTAMEDAISSYYLEALQAEQLDPVSQPELDVDVFSEEEGCTFSAAFEVRPSVEAPDHTGISITFPEWDVDEAAIDEQLADMRERFAEVDEVERPATTGDMVTLDLHVEIDGEELEASHVEDALYEVGSGGVTPKLDEELVGVEAGATFAYDDVLPEDYPQHGGEPATFHVTVKDVREKVLPELDDDFALSASGFDTMDELRRDLRNSLLRRRIEEAQHDLRGQAVEAYLARVEVELPPAMIADEVAHQVDQIGHQAQQYGLDVEQLFAAQGMTREEYEANAEEGAAAKVKAQLVLDALAQRLELPIEPAELDQEIVRHAQSTGMEPRQVAQIIQEQGSLPMLIGDIMRRKAIDAVVADAEVTGGPDDEVLIELGLLPDPNAPDEVDTDTADAPAAVDAPAEPDEQT